MPIYPFHEDLMGSKQGLHWIAKEGALGVDI